MRRSLLTAVGLILATAGARLALPGEVERHLPEPNVDADPSDAGTLVVDLLDGASESELARVGALIGTSLTWLSPDTRDEALAIAQVPSRAAAIAQLAGDPGVEVVEAEVELHAFGYPDDPLYPRQWHLDAMGAPRGWAETPRGRGVVVAVLDTGVALVEDLDPDRVLEGVSFVRGESSWVDLNGHGTHVAGTIGQTTHNQLGVAGVAPEAYILPVRVLDRWGSGTSEGIAAGIDWAVDHDADVINLSLGGRYSRVVDLAVRKARAAGVVVVAAVGNSGSPEVSYPGALASTLGVAAVGPDGKPAPYSSWGSGVDIAAPGGVATPGGGVLQNTLGEGEGAYRELQGTSMATPHVAGAAAVLLSTGQCGPSCVERALLGSARGQGWEPHLGRGLLDLGGALDAVQRDATRWRMGFGALVAFLVATLARGAAGFWLQAALWAALLAGPLSPAGLGIVGAPSWLGGPEASGFPPWTTALLPLVVALTLGAWRPTRAFAVGLCGAFAAGLCHGAWYGSVDPWWMGEQLGSAWLSAQALVCVVLGMGLAGVHNLEGRAS